MRTHKGHVERSKRSKRSKNGCELTKNRIEPLFQINEAKWQGYNDVSSKLELSVF